MQTASTPQSKVVRRGSRRAASRAVASLAPVMPYDSAMASEKAQVDAYYRDISLADELRKDGRAQEALKAALANLARLPALVSESKREYGQFDLRSVPAVETGITLAAVLEDATAMQRIRAVVENTPEMNPWLVVIEQGEQDLQSVRAILELVSNEPGVVQSSLGKRTGTDGRRASNLSNRLAQAGRLRREKAGASYQLFCTDTS